MSPDEKNEDGRLGQDEIDSLLGAGDDAETPDTGGDAPEGTGETVYGGEITGEQVIKQADIDSLLEAAQKGPGDQRQAPAKVFAADAAGSDKENLGLLMDIALNVKIELGKSSMPLEDILKLHEGSVVELDKLAGDPLDIVVNGRLIARGEVLVLNDNFCVRITDILSPEERLKASTHKTK